MSTASRRAALALPAALVPASVQAQAGLPEGGGQLAAGAVVIGVMLVFLGGAWTLLRRLGRELGAGAAGARLAELPLGVPEGSVRALLSVFIIVFGFLLLALAGPLGLRAGEALTGFIGAVISFYFATRAGEGAARSADAVREAARAAEALAAAARPPAATEALREAERRLRALRPLLAALPPGGALERVDGLLGRLAAAIGTADGPVAEALAAEAAALLAELGELGPVGEAVTGAVSTIAAIAADSAPIARGLGALGAGAALGGPAGLVGAVLLGGLGLVRERERFARWKAAMLEVPLEPGLLPRVVDAGLAAAALLRSPGLAAALAPGGTLEPALALATWEAAGWREGEAPRPAREVAERILAGIGPGQLRTIFLDNPEALAEAVEEFRAAMTGAAALAGLGIEAVAVGDAAVPVGKLADAVRVARQDGRIAAEIERLVGLAEALGAADAGTLARVVAGIPALLRGA